MARFRATIKGNRGEASRLGTAGSGITARVNGWNEGIRVEAVPNTEFPERDYFAVYITGGSNGYRRETFLLAVYTDAEGNLVVDNG